MARDGRAGRHQGLTTCHGEHLGPASPEAEHRSPDAVTSGRLPARRDTQAHPPASQGDDLSHKIEFAMSDAEEAMSLEGYRQAVKRASDAQAG